ncbi:MAG: hypothetical protein N2749_00160 [Clostridia bacterium]|nr:hypothetical protein [Clostridia bacterium]
MKISKLKGSGILVVVLSAVVFMIYASSTYSEQEHYELLQKKYEDSIVKYYEKNIDNIEDMYIKLTNT